MGPGRPLMVCASDMFGGNPDCVAWFITASTSAFHHSPTIAYFLVMFSKNNNNNKNMILQVKVR